MQAGLAALREQAQQQPEQRTAAGETAGQAHLLFVPPASGYALIEFDGPDPPSGTLLDVDDVSFVIRRVGPSPFPESRLRCVFLDRL